MQIYRPRLTHLNEKEVLRYAGQRDHQKMILGDLKKACREALLLAQPQCTWNIYDYKELHINSNEELIFRFPIHWNYFLGDPNQRSKLVYPNRLMRQINSLKS